jgi:multidrug transporter EmrE-like cation transporter
VNKKRELFSLVMATQIIFSSSDLLARWHFGSQEFRLAAFASGWVVIYFVIREVAGYLQIRVLASNQLGISMAIFSGAGIIISNVFGWLLFGEVPGIRQLIALGFILAAYAVIFSEKPKVSVVFDE